MEKANSVWCCLVVLSLVHTISAFSTGAGRSACANLLPGHGVPPQNTPAPFTFRVSANQFTPSSSIDITVEGDQFAGFLILAVQDENSLSSASGSFSATGSTPASAVQLMCSSGMTHTSNFGQRNKVELKWKAPNGSGSVVFVATIVKEFRTFWQKLKAVSPMPILSNTLITNQSSAASTQTAVAAQPTGADRPLTSPVDKKGCLFEKSCFDSCTGLLCSFLLTWKANGDQVVDFELAASGVSGYVAIRFVDDSSLNTSSLIVCARDPVSKVKVRPYYASGTEAPEAVLSGISEAAYKASLMLMSCRFSYNNAVGAASSKWKDLNGPLSVVIQRGSVDSSGTPQLTSPASSNLALKIIFTSSGTSGNLITISSS